MIKTISNSQLSTWLQCRLKWHYNYQRTITLPDQSPVLASGSTIHQVIGEVLGGTIALDDVPPFAEALLQDFFTGKENAQDMVDRFLPGAIRAIGRVPEAVYEHNDWHVEEEFNHEIAPDLWFHGYYDLYRIDDDGVHLTEIKSTSKMDRSPLDYLLFNPQHRYYAITLSERYQMPVWVDYIVVSTGKTGLQHTETSWLMTKRALAEAKESLIYGGNEIGELAIVPNYSRACDFCEYNQLCTARITGADTEPLIADYYIQKEPRA